MSGDFCNGFVFAEGFLAEDFGEELDHGGRNFGLVAAFGVVMRGESGFGDLLGEVASSEGETGGVGTAGGCLGRGWDGGSVGTGTGTGVRLLRFSLGITLFLYCACRATGTRSGVKISPWFTCSNCWKYDKAALRGVGLSVFTSILIGSGLVSSCLPEFSCSEFSSTCFTSESINERKGEL